MEKLASISRFCAYGLASITLALGLGAIAGCAPALPCFSDSDCDDGVFCTGIEWCGDGTCYSGAWPCVLGEEHCGADGCFPKPEEPDPTNCEDVEETDVACLRDSDCPTNLYCYHETRTCLREACCNDANCAPDRMYCGNDGWCAPLACGADADCPLSICTNGLCDVHLCNEDNDCRSGFRCNLEWGECESGASPCSGDAQCDDGLFCTGAETCDVATADCVSGATPCASDQTCDEENDACISVGSCYTPGDPVLRTLPINPPSGTLLYGVEDNPPAGWTVGSISDGGAYDAGNNAVKWFFLDGQSRTLTYTATPPGGATGNRCFGGVVNFGDGANQSTGSSACFDLCTGGQ